MDQRGGVTTLSCPGSANADIAWAFQRWQRGRGHAQPRQLRWLEVHRYVNVTHRWSLVSIARWLRRLFVCRRSQRFSASHASHTDRPDDLYRTANLRHAATAGHKESAEFTARSLRTGLPPSMVAARRVPWRMHIWKAACPSGCLRRQWGPKWDLLVPGLDKLLDRQSVAVLHVLIEILEQNAVRRRHRQPDSDAIFPAMCQMWQLIRRRQSVLALLAQDRPPCAVRLDFDEMLLPVQYQRHSQGNMPVTPAVSATLGVSQQHVQPPGRQVVTKQAVLEIDLEFRAGRVGDPPPRNGARVETCS